MSGYFCSWLKMAVNGCKVKCRMKWNGLITVLTMYCLLLRPVSADEFIAYFVDVNVWVRKIVRSMKILLVFGC